MARRKNVKRIDPRYFLHETVNRGEELEEDKSKRPEPYVDPTGEPEKRHTKEEPELEEGLPFMKDVDRAKKGQIPPEQAARIKGATDSQWPGRRVLAPDEVDPFDQAYWTPERVAALQAKLKPKELEEGCPHAEEGGEAIDISAPGMEVHVDDISQLSPEEAFAAGMAAARDAIDQVMGGPEGPPPEDGFSGGGPMGAPAMHEEITHDPRSPMEALEAKAWAIAFPKAWAELKKMGDGILDLVRAAGIQTPPEPESVGDETAQEL